MTTADEVPPPPGVPGSGRRRYATAMRRHAEGDLSDAELEAFRTLSPRDGEDPGVLGVTLPPELPSPEAALGALRAELLDVLHGPRGPGVAEARALLAAATVPPRVAPQAHPAAARWLPAALGACPERGLAAALRSAAPHLAWTTYAYDDPSIGPRFPEAHAFCPLAGPEAPWAAHGVELGLFLIGPRVLYRDHAHPAPELYLPLTGPHRWRFRPGGGFVPKPALVPVWNDPGAPHAVLTGTTPFLALYAWLGALEAPACVLPAPDWARWEAGPPG